MDISDMYLPARAEVYQPIACNLPNVPKAAHLLFSANRKLKTHKHLSSVAHLADALFVCEAGGASHILISTHVKAC